MSFISLPVKPKIVIITSSGDTAPALAPEWVEARVPLAHLTLFAQRVAPPAAYMGWVMGRDYDAFDSAQALVKGGFAGRCLLVSQTSLPRPEMVLGELAGAFPELSFSLWSAAKAAALAQTYCEALSFARPVTPLPA
ncbi:hypothetical protein [uncultured Lentibacter sp.]|uniref:hypothetical protein n=1 Tax=uncultured Lentibacter sp. TaxID=1659309 RepID=UPI0026120ED4|nr:hypothetical protein [uncultured Lentibacter sp.]